MLYIISVQAGFNDKETRGPLHRPSAAVRIMEAQAKARGLDGWTITRTKGAFTHGDGHFITEEGARLDAVIEAASEGEAVQEVKALGHRIGQALNQEAVILSARPCDTIYYTIGDGQ